MRILWTLLAIGIIVAAAIVWGGIGGQELDLTKSFDYTLFAITVIFFAIILFKALHVLWWVVSSLYRQASASAHIGEASSLQRLCALAIAAILFPSVVSAIVRVALEIGTSLFTQLPRAASAVLANGATCIADTDFARCAPELFSSGTAAVSDVLQAVVFRSGLAGFEVVDLLLFATAYALTLYGITRSSTDLPFSTKLWIGYGAAAVLGIYLALSATLAVPLMRDSEPVAELPADVLRDRLLSFYTPRVVDGGKDPMPQAAIAAAATSTEGRAADAAPSITQRAITQAERRVQREALAVRDTLREMTDGFDGYRTGLINNAVTVYETESAVRLGEREKSRHFLDIVTWYRQGIEARLGQIAACRAASSRLGRIGQDLRAEELRALGTTGTEGDGRAVESIFAVIQGSVRDADNAASRCRDGDKRTVSPPARTKYGSSLGIVGVATSWLLVAENMPATIIVGLIGYGLIGALVSRFVVRPKSERRPDTIGEIAGVVLRGFVAAMVVYVGAYGGIAIISTVEGDPEPYVIFFVCLAAAVFSERAWEKVREQIDT